jgi:polysaccharide biosynthesis/export protein
MKRFLRKILRYRLFKLDRYDCFCLLILFSLIGAGTSIRAQTNEEISAPKSVSAIEPLSIKADANYKIGIGDVLRVIVVKQELLSLDGVRVDNNGAIRLPMVKNDIVASCRTEGELTAEITDQYKKYLLNPQVYVAVKEFNSNPVAVVGAVMSPGRFQLQRPMRLLELLTFVNGPAPTAGKNVQLIRNPNAKRCEQTPYEKTPAVTDESLPEIISLPLAEVMKGDEISNPYIQAGDIIRINEAEQSFAYIIGNVKNAVIVNLKEPVTLSKALAMAGGVAPGAQSEKIRISRQSPGSLRKTEIVVNFKDIDKRVKEDILLEANDIVDVPGASGTRKLLKDILRTAVPIVTRVPLIIP